MTQSSTIAFFLIAGFVMYITVKGELTDYAGVLGIGPKSSQYGSTWTKPPSQSSSGGAITGVLGTLGSLAAQAAGSVVGIE